jgi:hypothetical protein
MSKQIGVALNFAQRAGRVLAASSKLERAIMQYQIEVKQSEPTYAAVIQSRV